MALYIAVEDAIQSWKEEQAKIHQSLQLCTEIIGVLTSQPRSSPGFHSEGTPPTDTPPVDNEELCLLERALEKAMQVRAGLEPVTRARSVKPAVTQNKQGAATKDSVKSSKGQTKIKLMSKTIEQKDRGKSQTTVHRSLYAKPVDGLKRVQTNAPKKKISNSPTHGNDNVEKLQGLQDHGQHALPYGSKKQIVKIGQLSGKNSKVISDSSTNNPLSFSKTMESGGNCPIQQEVLKWTHLKHKENGLWDKILALELKSSVCGKDQFMTQMRATFPIRWPCGCPEKIHALVHRLSAQDPVDDRRTDDRMASRTPEDGTKRAYFPLEWESWDRWRPEWGCLYPMRADGERHEGRTTPLPMTVTYSTEKELTEFEALRMRVELLQQEVCQETALSDTLSPHLSSVIQGPLNASLLRDLYSALGEGGERFPAIVLDSEPDS
ncbi:tubulin epsilon and delta complex protein 2 [Eucyclogobius newberryi]|uniref:tubulin epsilon and delta complex protein 2 n=1 Tax=Eucyclogobius newberryi TaxID=166745 RepID=UPI003B59A5A8